MKCHAMSLLLVAALMQEGCSSGHSHPAASSARWQGSALVHAGAGDVEGFAATDKVWAWWGIPFVRPPVGELRWQAPKAMDAWPGVFNADTLGNPCPQLGRSGDEILGDENCLTLNIWRPRDTDRNLPVYVWIHGGGNSMGDAMDVPEYDGANYSEHANAVFVSVNYRLGPLGWFVHSSLATGNAANDSGNFGTLDIIAALQWVNDNIEAFGGNPENVTVHGQSAGAIDVMSLMLSPLAHGLFHRAIIQSGMSGVTSMAAARVQTDAAITKLLITDGTVADADAAADYLASLSPTDIAAYLRRQSPAALIAAFPVLGGGILSMSTVFVDGDVIPAEGVDAFVSGNYPNKVPVIIGCAEDEARLFVSFDPGVTDRDDLFAVVADYGSDLWKARGVDGLARQLRSHDDQPPVYVYQFQWGAYREDGSSPIPAPWAFRIGATHNVDAPFFFRNDTVLGDLLTPLLFTDSNLAGRKALSDALSNYTAHFAANGNPNGEEQLETPWQAWSNAPGEPKQILLNVAGDNAAISMSNTELTADGVLNALATEVAQPLASEALDYMKSSSIFCQLVTGSNVANLSACE